MKHTRAAAGDRDVAIAGGAAIANQYLAAGAIDELCLHIVPTTPSTGEKLFNGRAAPLTLELLTTRSSTLATHVRYRP